MFQVLPKKVTAKKRERQAETEWRKDKQTTSLRKRIVRQDRQNQKDSKRDRGKKEQTVKEREREREKERNIHTQRKKEDSEIDRIIEKLRGKARKRQTVKQNEIKISS